MKKVWKTPPLDYYNIYADMLSQPHLLIAGATGSGKSVVINGIITTALKDSPSRVQFVLIDPKRVELIDYAPRRNLSRGLSAKVTNCSIIMYSHINFFLNKLLNYKLYRIFYKVCILVS